MAGLDERPVIALIDPRPLLRELVASYLRERMSDFSVHQASSPAEIEGRGGSALRALILFQPSIEAELPEAYAQISRLRQAFPDAPVIVVSDVARGDVVRQAFRSGANGFIPTITSLSIFEHAIRTVLAGGEHVPSSVLNSHETSGPLLFGKASPYFTPRQQQVLELLREGLPNKLIAYKLDMRESTVKVHLRQIMRKMNVANRTQVVAVLNEARNGEATDAGVEL